MSHDSGKRSVVGRIIDNQESLIVRLYARIRFVILREDFLREIGQYLPQEGRVLDLGCGFGLFSLYFGLVAPGRKLTGIDLSEKRVAWATRCAEKLGATNVEYSASDLVEWEGRGEFDAVYMLDLMHHLPKDAVPEFLKRVVDLIVPGGVLVLKDVSNRPLYKKWFTLALDRLMVGMDPIHYWDPEEIIPVLEGLGLSVKRHTMNDILPYPHILYVCTRT